MTQHAHPIAPNVIDDAVLIALDEDGAQDDLTTRAIVRPGQWGHGVFVARDAGVVAGLAVAAAAMTALDETVSFDALIDDGSHVTTGAQLAEVEGSLAAILAAERVALNFLQHLSGVATLTSEFVEAVSGTRARILDTRKTTPGLRHFERYAVRVGGGVNHRFNLSTGILIKDNHIAAAHDAGSGLATILQRARDAAPHTMRIEIEVTTLDEFNEALAGKADVILLDNMAIEEIRRCVELAAGRAVIEASGGVTLSNVRAVADTGVDFISIGRLTHSAPALDISLEVGGV